MQHPTYVCCDDGLTHAFLEEELPLCGAQVKKLNMKEVINKQMFPYCIHCQTKTVDRILDKLAAA